MAGVEKLITEHIDVWTSAIKKRNATGRGSNKKIELTGIKKLRELILELAVRGKLVPQDANDEPASVLLAKIAEEKAQLIADKKIKKQKPLPVITDEEKPFVLPLGWEWERFPNIAHYIPGKTPSTKNAEYWTENNDGVPWVSISDMVHYQSIIATNKRLTNKASIEVFKRDLVKAGTILMSFKLTVGKVSILDVDAYHNEAIISVTPFKGISKEFLYRFIPSRALSGNTKKAIMGNTLNSESLALITFPVPPLAEQHRIVAKVDELMALCDQLEQQTEQSLTTHQTLVEVLLASLTSDISTDANNKEDFQISWQRIAEYFDVLFTTEASIEQLKQTILQLAVMGKLVPQNPIDEPASVLLEKIAEEKAQLITDKKIKKQKLLPAITDEDQLFELPDSWEWCRFGDLCKLVTSGSRGWKSYYSDVGSIFIRSQDIKYDRVEFDNRAYVELPANTEGKRTKVELNDLLMTITGANVAKCAVVNIEIDDAYVSQHVALIKLVRQDINRLIHTWITGSHGGRNHLLECSYGAKPGLNLQNINELLIPIPPVEEQHRIVAKVDELMALCEQLKARLSDAQTTQLHLADAVVESALT
ncbi:restriction endonuclease subunit S [Colwellia sp. MB3u-70]|uniref:restriction endonuclease subunit S n=1 Tax=unclassified Colwellia TaxID=196834 RepID=UPI0015F412DF|nr:MULTISPECIES: restriction endonuclease subunit S [unclassified Colwellia]MBA6292330.1 restriction endonuclease subunit S [Colwellia sp. MB3u-8]MBA6306302.1 restriction endonuclease subunit S [Colwellia sp. MB3u-70]